MRYATIIAGGSGTRLWPMSQADLPKQLIPLFSGRSLLEIAVDRLQGFIPPERQILCTGEKYRRQIRRVLPEFADERILGEPEGRDTLAAVGLPAAVAMREDADAIIGVFTADHLIEPVEQFQRRVEVGYELAEKHPNTLVTFGIEPAYAATGFGYVELGRPLEGFDQAYRAVRFVEKPDARTAEQYVASGRYAWNSGMFVWRAATLLDCIERDKPEVHAGLMQIAAAWATPERRHVLEQVYPRLEKISVDFAVMEPASADEAVAVATVAMPLQWLDVGSWTAYGEILAADAEGNRLGGGRAVLLDSANNLLVSEDPGHLVAAVGIEDLVVVHTPRVTMICRRDQAQRIKELYQAVEQRGELQ